MRELAFSYENLEAYYTNRYFIDLHKYFTYYHHNSILDLTRHPYNSIEGSPCHSFTLMSHYISESNSTELNFYFSGIFLSMILIQKEFIHQGNNNLQEWNKVSGWPWISAGLAGPDYDAMKMLEEATLAPVQPEINNYIRMLTLMESFIEKEIRKTAYDSSIDSIIAGYHCRMKELISQLLTNVSSSPC